MGLLRVCDPIVGRLEKKYLSQAIDEGEISSGGKFVQRFEEAFADWSGNRYAVAVASGTAALEVAIWAMNFKDISLPVGTIISCYIAAFRAGAKIKLRDNVAGFERDMMLCHLFGKPDPAFGLFNIEDCSQYWKPFRVSDMACYSLYANKLISAGEGGIIITNQKTLYDRARYYRNLCHSKERFIHNDLGYNFRISNLQAAVALAQLEQIDKFIEIKQRNRDLYLKHLPNVERLFDVEVPWMYLIKTKHDAGVIVKELQEIGIECRRFFYPLHRQPCINLEGRYPVADGLWKHAFYLPSGLTLTEKDIVHVCTGLRSVLRAF